MACARTGAKIRGLIKRTSEIIRQSLDQIIKIASNRTIWMALFGVGGSWNISPYTTSYPVRRNNHEPLDTPPH